MRRIWSDESGSSLVLVAMMMTVLMTMTAFVIDIGGAYVRIAQAQNAVDAAVLAAAQLLPVRADNWAARESVVDEVCAYAAQNGCGELERDQVALIQREGQVVAVRADLRVTVPTSFARIVGVKELSAQKSASAGCFPVGGVSGAVPIGISEEAFVMAQLLGETKHLTLKEGGGDGTNGVFGYISLDESKGNANLLLKWMKYGYEGVNYVGDIQSTPTGNVASAAKQGCDYRISQCTHYQGSGGCTVDHFVAGCPRVAMVIIYESADWRSVRIKGFAPFIIEGVTNQGEIVGSYVDAILPALGEPGDLDCGAVSIGLVE